MSTYGTIISRIEREVHRDNTNAEVSDAVLSAIAYYEDDVGFAWNTERATASTTADEKYISLPADFIHFIGAEPLQITVNQSTYNLTRRTWGYLQNLDLGAAVGAGIPYDWAYGDQQIRLYPEPSGAYTLTMYYKKKLTALSDSADTNAWVVQGERLIRFRAKWDLYENVIHQFDKATRQKAQEMEEYAHLSGIEPQRAIAGRMTPSYL